MLEFRTTAEWVAWVERHPQGFFVNVKSGMIHRISCPNYRFDDGEDGKDRYFFTPKPCHASRAALTAWVLERLRKQPKPCKSCS